MDRERPLRRIPPEFSTVADYFAAPYRTHGERAWIALSLGMREQLDSSYQAPTEVVEDTLPRWPSTIERLDQKTGGCYGVTVIAGEKKLGKTRLALAVGVAAAATKRWQVVYLSAELDSWEISSRLQRMFDVYPETLECADNLHVIHVGRGLTLDYLRTTIEEVTDAFGDPLLVVMDSVNTIAELMSPMPYLVALKELGLWAMLSRRLSCGSVSWLLISETNRMGGVKGGKLDYWADMIVRLKRAKDPALAAMSGAPIALVLDASRRTGGAGPLGLYVRDHGERLVEFAAGQTSHLRVVGDVQDELF